MDKKQPRVGVGVLVFHQNTILLGKRVYSHGTDTWCPPGGHLEFGETPEECAARELEEETSLIANRVIVGPWTNDFYSIEEKHYLTLNMVVHEFQGTPKVQEPEKCLRWEWYPIDSLPSPLFLSFENLLKKECLENLVPVYSL